MTMGLCYWILMLLWFVGVAVVTKPQGWAIANLGITFLLFLLLGWQVFGAPIK